MTVSDQSRVPLWVRDPATRKSTLRVARQRTGRELAWSPVTLVKWSLILTGWFFRGLGRATAQLAKWIGDKDSADLQASHADSRETAEYTKLHQVRRSHLQARLIVTMVGALLVGGPVAFVFAPYVLSTGVGLFVAVLIVKAIPGRGLHELVVAAGLWLLIGLGGGMWLDALVLPEWVGWALYVLVAVAIGLLTWHGRPRPETKQAAAGKLANTDLPVKLDVVREALCSLGIAGMNNLDKHGPQIGALQMPHRNGAGVQVDLQLPSGIEAVEVVKRSGRLAAALRREEKCVHLARGRRHAGHLVIYVADEPMTEQDQGKWALDGSKARSVFESFPAGTNVRGQWVSLTLAYANAVIGAMPRQGKTFFLRELALAAGHDLRTKHYTLDGKGTGDFRPLEPFAHFTSMGDDPEEIDRVLGALREIRTEMRRRARVLAQMTPEECPENKITDDLANRAGFEPIVVTIDETQAYFCYGGKLKQYKPIRDEFEEIVTDLVKRGPALGVIILLATQSVNGDTIPRGISTNAVIRFALRLFDESAVNQILGPGAYGKGYDTTAYDQEDKGVGILRADGPEPETIRTVFGLDGPRVRDIAKRLAALRLAAGRLTGQAAGEDVEPEPGVSLLDDVREVMDGPDGARRLHLATVLELLRLLRPELYGPMDVEGLGGALRGAGVSTPQVKVGARNTTGIRREDLDIAFGAEDDEEGDDDEDNVVSMPRR